MCGVKTISEKSLNFPLYGSVLNTSNHAQDIILFFIPFYDGIYVTIKRLTLRKKLFEPDKNHLHHLVPNSKWNYSLLFLVCRAS